VATGGQRRVQALAELVRALATEKAGHPGRQVSATDAEFAAWERRMPHEARMTFEPEPPASAWVPPSQRLQPGWDPASLYDAILVSEYDLRGVVLVGDSEAELQFEALAWPYGGISSLIALVEAFGFDALAFLEGSAPPVTREAHLRDMSPTTSD
jgi:hypothetical protein